MPLQIFVLILTYFCPPIHPIMLKNMGDGKKVGGYLSFHPRIKKKVTCIFVYNNLLSLIFFIWAYITGELNTQARNVNCLPLSVIAHTTVLRLSLPHYETGM